MARHLSCWRRTHTTLGILVAAAWSGQVALGQTTYTFQNPDNEASVEWHDDKYWNPPGIPNAPGDAAVFNRPTVTPSEVFTLILDQDATIGSMTIDNTNLSLNHNFILDVGGTLTFQSTSGPATLTETAGGNNAGRLVAWPDMMLLSDLVTTQNNRPELNSSSLVHGLIAGASHLTITKEGEANLQLSHHGASGFEGQYVINDGGIRLTGSSNIAQSSGVTVNSGGQLQLDAAVANPVADWSLADGAVLILNGLGKSGGSAAPGALRFQGLGADAPNTKHSTFHNPVELQTDTRIAVGPATVTGELTNVVSGEGGLIKAAVGTLLLSNPENSYAGDTTIQANGGTLSITHPFLADDADVYLSPGTTLHLNFTDTDVIRSFFIDGQQQASGTWGAVDNFDADFQIDLITGSGMLQVMVGAGIAGDYNNDGMVDAADYVLWRDQLGSSNPLPNDGGLGTPIDSDHYTLWRSNFGQSASGAAVMSMAAVPEPSSAGLVLLALLGGLSIGRSWSRDLQR